jgi:DHA3 family macrolide efflux protein-like MFS transporter
MTKFAPFDAILDANSQRLFWGQLISQTCDKLMSVGMIWVLTTRFDPKWVPWFIAFGALPHLLLASKSGTWINRWGALPTVIWADALRGVLFLICAGIVARADSDATLLVLLFGTVLISNVAGALFNPAMLSLPVAMMDASAKRDKLTALIDSCFSWGNVFGPLLSVATYSMAGLGGMLAVNGLSYFFSAVLALGIKLKSSAGAPGSTSHSTKDPASNPEDQPGDSASSISVMSVLKSKPVISGMLITFLLMNFFLAPLMIFMPWYAKNIFSEGITGLAKLEVFFAVGTVVGGSLLSFVRLPGTTANRITFSLCSMAVAYLGFTFSHNLLLACLALGILGFFLALANVVILTFFQTSATEEEVPIVMGMVNLISVASLPISMGIVGAFIDSISVPTFATVCAAIVIAIALSIRFIPGIRAI